MSCSIRYSIVFYSRIARFSRSKASQSVQVKSKRIYLLFSLAPHKIIIIHWKLFTAFPATWLISIFTHFLRLFILKLFHFENWRFINKSASPIWVIFLVIHNLSSKNSTWSLIKKEWKFLWITDNKSL
jgi:hypothetical protein